MSESKKKLIEQMINGIDEKFIDKTAERLYGKTGKVIEVTEMTKIIVDKPAEKKYGKLSGFIRIALPTAAVMALAIGAGFLISRIPVEPKDPNVTTAPKITEPSGTAAAYSSSDYASYSEISSAEFDGYVVKLLADQSEENAFLCLSAAANDPTVSEGVIYETKVRDLSAGEIKCSIKGYKLKSGNLVTLFQPFEGEDGSIEYSLTFYHTSPEMIQRMSMRFMAFSEYSFIQCDEGADIINIHPTTADDPVVYYVDFENNTLSDEPPREPTFNESLHFSNYEFSSDSALFEEIFYGKWLEKDGIEVINLTYYDSNAYEPWKRYYGYIAKTDNGYIMQGLSGGLGIYLYKPDNEDLLYYYSIDEGSKIDYSVEENGDVIDLDSYCGVYERMSGVDISDTGEWKHTDYSFSGTLRRDKLTGTGINKLREVTGCTLSLPPDSAVSDNGNSWVRQGNMEFGYGDFYLLNYDSDHITFSAQYSPKGIDLDDHIGRPEEVGFRYLYFKYEKVDGEWVITHITEYDTSLEESTGVPAGVYTPLYLSDGRYYLMCRPEDEWEETKYYYWNGKGYSRLDFEGFYASETSMVFDDTLFVLSRSDNGDYYVKAFINGTRDYYGGNIVFEDGLDYQGASSELSAYKIGIYTMIEVKLHTKKGYTAEKTLVFDSNPFESEFIPFESVTVDEDKGGFTAVPGDNRLHFTAYIRDDGTVRYRPDSDKLSDVLWSLDNEASLMWFNTKISTPLPGYHIDINDNICINDVNYFCLCTQEDFTEYASSFLVDDAVPKPRIYNGRVYLISGARGANADIWKIDCEIESEDENSAVIRYDCYERDRNTYEYTDNILSTYTVEAEKTENGWRLCRLYVML